jgi:general secretion pathway protein G
MTAVQSSRRWGHNGFTLIELMVVMAVLGLLASLLLPLAELNVQRDRERELRAALQEIRGAIDAYRAAVKTGEIPPPANESGYPPSLRALVESSVSSRGQVKHFLRRVPRDPFAEPGVPAELTWALRSHESPPDAPRPGADVYDVASRSERMGLNGVPLKEW